MTVRENEALVISGATTSTWAPGPRELNGSLTVEDDHRHYLDQFC
jgi:hypothetical protein